MIQKKNSSCHDTFKQDKTEEEVKAQCLHSIVQPQRHEVQGGIPIRGRAGRQDRHPPGCRLGGVRGCVGKFLSCDHGIGRWSVPVGPPRPQVTLRFILPCKSDCRRAHRLHGPTPEQSRGESSATFSSISSMAALLNR